MIVSCGEALADVVASSDSGMLVKFVPGGGPLNVAVAVARLGAPNAFVGRVSTDGYGEQIWKYLTDNGVNLNAAERGPEPTALAVVEHTPKLTFRFEGTATADTLLSATDLALLGTGPHILHGGTLGLFRGRTAEVLAQLAEQHDGIVSLDPNVRPQIIAGPDETQRWRHFHDRWRKCAHIYKASDEDIEWIWPNRPPSACAAELLEGAAEVVFITHGPSGATCYTPEDEISVDGIPLDPAEIADTVGAGDSFIGTVLALLHQERGSDPSSAAAGNSQPASKTNLTSNQWREITQQAVLASALTCTRPGADPPTASELTQWRGAYKEHDA